LPHVVYRESVIVRLQVIRLITAVAVLLLVAPFNGDAQRAGNLVRIGFLSSTAARSAPYYEAFFQALRELGYIEGKNLTVDFRTAEGKTERLAEFAADLVRLKVDVIVASGPEAVLRAARAATVTIPIVVVAVDFDPVAKGYAAGIRRPGGNVTGVFLRQPELSAKRLELLNEALPKATRIAILWHAFSSDQLEPTQAAARALGVQLQLLETRNPSADYSDLVRAAVRGQAQALLVTMFPQSFRDRTTLTGIAIKNRLPTIFGLREYAAAGAFMSYGANIGDMFRLAAVYVDKVLKGAKPADLPIEQPTKFELVINLKTAKALGITIPQSILLRADDVIR
jgi:putative ABC transport system substrate-binding protein